MLRKRGYMKKSYIKYAILLLLLVIAAIIITSRWNVWFGNPTEAPYSTPSTPSRILLTVGNNAQSRIITWQCDTILQEAFVEYYKCDTLSSIDTCRAVALGEVYISEGGKSAFYRATIDSLTLGSYAYRVCHPTATSNWNRFDIADAQDNSTRFVFIGDIQDTLNGTTNKIVDSVVKQHNKIDFFVQGGDFIHRPQEIYWEEGFRGIASIATTYPTLAVSGNHEHLKGITSTSERRFPLHFAYYIENYNSTGCCYHTMRYDNIEFFLLDSHCDIVKLIQQRSTLKKALKESSAQWKIAILHHPPYSIRNKWNNLHLQWLFAPLFTQYQVHLVLSGHEHGYARIHPNGMGTTPIYTISHCSPKQYKHDNSRIAQRYANDNRYYQVIDADNDTLQIECYTCDGTLYDTTQIIQENGTCIVK